MDAPGDKTKVEEVVKEKLLDSSPEIDQDTTHVKDKANIQEMGFLQITLPQVDLLSSGSSVQKLPELPFHQNLEQTRIDDYYTQTKYCTNIFHPIFTYSNSPQKIYQTYDQPGPSGLQFKTKPTVKSKKNTKTFPLETKSHICQICQKGFVSSEKLNKHYQSHPQFKCEHCKKSFTSKFKLVRHKLIHSDRKPFSCVTCGRTFHRKDHLKNHIKIHSPTKKIYICEKEDCKRKYTSILSYRKHLALHAAQDGSLECQICSSIFKTKDDILFHLKIHAGSRTVKDPNEKKYTCEHCERKFFTKKDVKRHLVVHTGMRDFLCQYCPQRFGRKDHLGRHIRKSHPEVKIDSQNDDKKEKTASSRESKTSAKVVIEQKSNKSMTSDVMSELHHTSIKLEPVLHYSNIPFTTDVNSSKIKTETMSTSPPPTDVIDYLNIQKLFPEKIENYFEGTLPEDVNLMLDSTHTDFMHMIDDLGQETRPETENIDQSSLTEAQYLPDEIIDDTQILTESDVLNNPEIRRLFQTTDDTNRPLPGFSQTFQLPPPQPPP